MIHILLGVIQQARSVTKFSIKPFFPENIRKKSGFLIFSGNMERKPVPVMA